MCSPTGGEPAGQVRRRRGSGRATVRAMPNEPRTDPLSVGLLVFFVALIGIVAALLILPAIF